NRRIFRAGLSVEAGLVQQPGDYPWSSCRVYALGEPDPLVTESPCYRELASEPSRRQELWREFLCGEDVREAAVRRGDRALGDDEFVQQMRQLHGRPQQRGRGRPRKGSAVNLAGISPQPLLKNGFA